MGNTNLSEFAPALYEKRPSSKVRKLAESLANDLRLRYHKYEDAAYALEPNIKEGEGGLRDFQAGRWIIRAKYKTDRWDSILFPDHSRQLEKSVAFLWTVRNQLHVLSGRRQDDLTFEFQEKIAPILGFRPGPEGVEEMMRQYHLSTQRISNFAQDILDRVLRDPSPLKKKPSLFSNDGKSMSTLQSLTEKSIFSIL